MPLFRKSITDYLLGSVQADPALARDHAPATAFLDEVVEICDAVQHCKRKFSRKANGEFTKDSADSFERLVRSSFAMLMSHFEQFEKEQFGALIDWSFTFACPDPVNLAKNLEKAGCELSLQRVLVGPGEEGQIGEIVADAMPTWHNSQRVNTYFGAIIPDHSFYSNEVVRELDKLWQIRHSIVHSGGVLTKADAIKVAGLSALGNKKLVFGEEFMPAIGRRFHIIIQMTMTQLINRMRELLIPLEDETEQEKTEVIDAMVGVKSRRPSWFRRKRENS